MAEITLMRPVSIPVKYLLVEANVRYWEDATINGEEDSEGTLTPFREDDCWCPTIELDTGVIENWPSGVIAHIHFKVADQGVYSLLDANRNEVRTIEGYVPKIMCPGENGYGDYIIMDIDGSGLIDKWVVNLAAFE